MSRCLIFMEQPSWWHKAFPAALKIPGNPGGKELSVRNPGYVGKMMLRFPSQEQQDIVKGHLYTSLMIHQNIPMFPWVFQDISINIHLKPSLDMGFLSRKPEKIITNWQLWRTNRMELRDLGDSSKMTAGISWIFTFHAMNQAMFLMQVFTSQLNAF